MKQIPARTALVTRSLAIVALAALVAACGRGKEETANAPAEPTADTAAPAVVENPEDKRLANAVATGKTAAPVDLKYDVLAKPAVGQPFEIELVFLPRLAANVLEVEVTGIPGLTIVSGGAVKFEGITAGERYATKVLAQGEANGLFYANVVVRMITDVQIEARTFSVPVAVGAVPAAEKPTPETDAAGEAVQSLPAQESGGAEEPAKN
jgi:hypothetical protein